MKADEAPFYLVRVECPVCATINEFETIKMGAYTEEGRDTDFCPTDRRWLNPRYQHLNPLLYFMAACASCYYTREYNRKFRDWKDDTAFRTYRQKTVRQRHLGALANTDGPVRRLGSAFWPSSYPLPTAINKLLLGIFDEQQLDQPSAFDVARWYLRIAWLFRESGGPTGESVSPRVDARRRLRGAFADLSDGIDRLRIRAGETRSLLESSPDSMANGPDDGSSNADGLRLLGELADQLAAAHAEMKTITAGLSGETSPVVGNETSDRDQAYGDHPSYGDFLRALQVDWSGVPTNEVEALTLSMEHYRKAYEEDRGIEPGNAQIQVTYLVGELARRVGRYDDAYQYLNLAQRLGREWIHQMGQDRSQTALARHIIDLAVEQLRQIDTAPVAGVTKADSARK